MTARRRPFHHGSMPARRAQRPAQPRVRLHHRRGALDADAPQRQVVQRVLHHARRRRGEPDRHGRARHARRRSRPTWREALPRRTRRTWTARRWHPARARGARGGAREPAQDRHTGAAGDLNRSAGGRGAASSAPRSPIATVRGVLTKTSRSLRTCADQQKVNVRSAESSDAHDASRAGTRPARVPRRRATPPPHPAVRQGADDAPLRVLPQPQHRRVSTSSARRVPHSEGGGSRTPSTRGWRRSLTSGGPRHVVHPSLSRGGLDERDPSGSANRGARARARHAGALPRVHHEPRAARPRRDTASRRLGRAVGQAHATRTRRRDAGGARRNSMGAAGRHVVTTPPLDTASRQRTRGSPHERRRRA